MASVGLLQLYIPHRATEPYRYTVVAQHTLLANCIYTVVAQHSAQVLTTTVHD